MGLFEVSAVFHLNLPSVLLAKPCSSYVESAVPQEESYTIRESSQTEGSSWEKIDMGAPEH